MVVLYFAGLLMGLVFGFLFGKSSQKAIEQKYYVNLISLLKDARPWVNCDRMYSEAEGERTQRLCDEIDAVLGLKRE